MDVTPGRETTCEASFVDDQGKGYCCELAAGHDGHHVGLTWSDGDNGAVTPDRVSRVVTGLETTGLHWPDHSVRWCQNCNKPWPCPSVSAGRKAALPKHLGVRQSDGTYLCLTCDGVFVGWQSPYCPGKTPPARDTTTSASRDA